MVIHEHVNAQNGEKLELPDVYIPTKVKLGSALPSLLLYKQVSFCGTLHWLISLFKMTPKYNVEVLSSVSKCKAVRYLLE